MITVLLNPKAGSAGSNDVEKRLQDLFEKAGVDARICLLGPAAHPADAARDALNAGSAAVVAGGGDGTVSAVASVLAGTSTPLGVLPMGTLNHFARDLHIPVDLAKAVATIAAGDAAPVDVGRLNDRLFINNASIGLYPNIVEVRDDLRRQGSRKFPALMSATAKVLWTYRGVVAAVESSTASWAGRTPFVFVGNNEYTMDGMSLGARQTLNGGRIVAYVTPRLCSRRLPLLLARALVGRALQSGAFAIVSASEVDIAVSGASAVRVALDGEVTTINGPLHFRSEPQSLKVFRPRE